MSPSPAYLHERFGAQSAKTPNAVALVFEGSELTYRELDERSNQLAHLLRARGVRRDVLVGVCAERSFEMVIALLAILKAGGAYVPLDPGNPPELLDFMVADSGVALVVAQKRHARLFATAVLLDGDEWAEHSTAPIVGSALPQSLAYMIFTSGSTGRPKGAMNTHEAIDNRIVWMNGAYGLTRDDVVLQKTPFGFDVSVWEFFWPLVNGARLVLARPDGHRDVEYLTGLIRDTSVTTLHFSPSMLAVFLESGTLTRCSSVRRVLCSGEALPVDLAQRFFERMPKAVALHNLYGPTEAAVDVTAWTCQPGESAVPIGRPIANVSIYVVNGALEVVGVGVTGELCIGGIAVGRGYRGRAALTAESFVPDAQRGGGARMYRTGDLARWREDGALEYLGRIDHQVKLRGFRIELGEIESVLREHASVQDAVVAVQDQGRGGNRLVAYVVSRDGTDALDVAGLRGLARRRLPPHMVPPVFVGIEKIPVTTNGKLDRRALPAPPDVRARLGTEVVAPAPGIETELLRLWEEELDVQPIGATDDFFELGGHSLLAVRLVARIDATFGRVLPIAMIVQHPTVRRLAQLLGAAPAEATPLLVHLHAGTQRPLFLVHPIGGNVFCYVEFARRLGGDQSVYGIQQRGVDGTVDPLSTVEEQATSYVDLVRSVQPTGPYLIGGWSYGGTVAYEMVRQLHAQGEEIALFANLDARASTVEARAKASVMLRDYDPTMLAFWFTVIMSRIGGIETPATLEDFEGRDETGLVGRIAEELSPHGSVAELAQLRIAFGLFRNNLRALGNYEVRPYGGTMTLFRAMIPVPKLAHRPTPPPWAWDSFCPHILIRDIENTHFLLFDAARVDCIATPMREAVERAHATIAGHVV